MINLDSSSLEHIKLEYISWIKIKVLNKINNLSIPIKNPFTNKVIFDKQKKDTETFIEDLLGENFNDLFRKHPEVENYFKTCQFIYYSTFQVDKKLVELNQLINRENRFQYRKEYLKMYDNEWIKVLLHKHTNYYKNNSNFKVFVNEIKNNLNKLNTQIDNVINYNLIDKEERHKLLFHLNVEVCPYCNRNYISKFKKNGKLKTTADLDHFYPKSQFTLFSLSLYNFVPSCQICNSRFKMAKGIKIQHPYIDKINYSDFKFYFSLKKGADISLFFNGDPNFDIKIKNENKMYKNNIELFELENLYNTHKSIASEVLYKKQAYTESYTNLFNNLFDNMNLNNKEISLFLYGINMIEADFFKKPLSKLIYDLVNDE